MSLVSLYAQARSGQLNWKERLDDKKRPTFVSLFIIAPGQTLQNEQAKYEPCELVCAGAKRSAELEGKAGRQKKDPPS